MIKPLLRLLPLILVFGCAQKNVTIQQPSTSPTAPVNAPPSKSDTSEVLTPSAKPLPPTTNKIKPSAAKSVTGWQIRGLMGVKSPKKSWTANLVWVQNGQNDYQLRLFGAMGGGTVLIERHHGVISYKDEHKNIRATKARTLVREQTGLDLPVESLYYWIRAIPAPGGSPRIAYNAENQPSVITQSGYTIQYMQYQQIKGRALPTKMSLQGHDVFIKLIIKDWQVG